jgi:hypothetical protein
VGAWCLDSGLDPRPVDGILDEPHAGDACSFGTLSAECEPELGPRTRPGSVRAATEWVTWQHAVWRFTDARGRTCRAVVPAEMESSFLQALDTGVVDATVQRMLRPVRRRRLLVNAQLAATPAGEATFWHDVRPGALVPAERLPDGTLPRVSRWAAHRDLKRSTA